MNDREDNQIQIPSRLPAVRSSVGDAAGGGEGRAGVDAALRVDTSNVVGHLNGGWNALVGVSRVAALLPTCVGDPFHRMFGNGDAHALYRVMLDRARRRFRVCVDVRAVTAERAVRYELSLVMSSAAGDVDITLRFLREQRRWTMPLFDRSAPRSQEAVKICDFCQRVLAFDWAEPDVALRQLQINPLGPQPRICAAVCGQCERTVYHAAGASRLGLAS